MHLIPLRCHTGDSVGLSRHNQAIGRCDAEVDLENSCVEDECHTKRITRRLVNTKESIELMLGIQALKHSRLSEVVIRLEISWMPLRKFGEERREVDSGCVLCSDK